MKKSKEPAVNRRNFLKSVAAGAASLAAPAEAMSAQPAAPQPSAAMPLLPPLIETDPPAEAEVLTVDRAGSDFMVDVIKFLGFDYVCSVAGSSFRGLHESVINFEKGRTRQYRSWRFRLPRRAIPERSPKPCACCCRRRIPCSSRIALRGRRPASTIWWSLPNYCRRP